MQAKKSNSKKMTVNLALQGGGSHGAFTWGVLDRLLEEPSLEFEGISGASAGAMNAAVFACGFLKNGREGARKELEDFWGAISEEGAAFNPCHQWTHFFEHHHLEWHPFAKWMDLLSQVLSPAEFNPFNYNPLKDIIRDNVDFGLLQKTNKFKLFVNATNVNTNKVKIFENEELCEEALLASACIPTLFQPVEWQGQHYWDGGYMGNPILEPLIFNCDSDDIIIVPINAINRKIVPTSSVDILDRLNEITFNSSLIREVRNIISMEKFSESTETINPFIGIRLHSISDDPFMEHIGASNKYNTDREFLKELKDKGRKTADKWIKKNFNLLGKETTMDLEEFRLETPSTQCLIWPHKD